MVETSYIPYSRNCILTNKMLSFRQNAYMNCTKDPTPGGHIFTMIKSRGKKSWLPSMVEMERKPRGKMRSIRYMLFPDIWRPMDFYFIPVICFRKNIETGHLSHSTVPGTVLLSLRKDFI